MREEFLLEKTFGKPNLFKVPEGYFETFEESVMDKIAKPATSKSTIKRFLRPMLYAACVMAVAMFSSLYLFNTKNKDIDHIANITHSANMASPAYHDLTFEEMSDYAMYDNDDLYSFIADEQ